MTFHNAQPHRALWQTVLFEAVNDAIHGPTTGTHGNRTPRDRLATWKRDRAYVLDGGKDFAAVCHLVGVDPVATREAVARQCEAKPITDKKRGRYRVAKPAPKAKPAPQRYEHDGLSLTAEEWSERTGINAGTIKSRINRHHWPVARAVTEKPGTAGANRAFIMRGPRRAKIIPIEARARDDAGRIVLTHDGHTRTVAKWSRITGLSGAALHQRIRKGWSDAAILTTPLRAKAPNGQGKTPPRTGRKAEAQGSAQAPGAPSDFRPSEGTGGGTTAQDRHELEFPA